jgi:hypothetical protein
MINSTEPRAYSLTARVLHWSTAILVLTVLPLGVVIGNEWGGPLQDQLYDLHRSIGATILLLVVVRLGYRLTHPPLPLPDDIAPIQRFAAQATHCALYALLIVQPLVGWIDRGVWVVRAAADLVRGSRILRPAFHGARVDCHCHRLPCGCAYRRCASPSFRAQGPRPHAHDHRLNSLAGSEVCARGAGRRKSALQAKAKRHMLMLGRVRRPRSNGQLLPM